MNATALKGFVERFRDILDGLDDYADSEDMEELNAQLEDAIFLLECADPKDEEEVGDALEEIASLAGEYRAQMNACPEAEEQIRDLETLAETARKNI